MLYYRDITQLFTAWHEYRNDADKWRQTPHLRGQINGLPNSRGTIVATNGILCLIDTCGNYLYEGHLDFFLPDAKERKSELNSLAMPKAAPSSTSSRVNNSQQSKVNQLVSELML